MTSLQKGDRSVAPAASGRAYESVRFAELLVPGAYMHREPGLSPSVYHPDIEFRVSLMPPTLTARLRKFDPAGANFRVFISKMRHFLLLQRCARGVQKAQISIYIHFLAPAATAVLGQHRRQHRRLRTEGESIWLGFLVGYREGSETVLFLQSLVIDAGRKAVGIGAAAGVFLLIPGVAALKIGSFPISERDGPPNGKRIARGGQWMC